mmetsp:Transcript_8546/g.36203  ORF Transcript_8546/g.36203 Transcript_8546/m.36203 type:complete len:223 (+) Transcript_8546:1685-2353(+)
MRKRFGGDGRRRRRVRRFKFVSRIAFVADVQALETIHHLPQTETAQPERPARLLQRVLRDFVLPPAGPGPTRDGFGRDGFHRLAARIERDFFFVSALVRATREVARLVAVPGGDRTRARVVAVSCLVRRGRRRHIRARHGPGAVELPPERLLCDVALLRRRRQKNGGTRLGGFAPTLRHSLLRSHANFSLRVRRNMRSVRRWRRITRRAVRLVRASFFLVPV